MNIKRIILFVLLFTALLLLGGEAGLRIAKGVNPLVQFLPEEYNRHRPPPGAFDFDFKLNSRGYKDREYRIRKHEGTYRIIAVGDSIHYGVVPYDKGYLFLLEERLNRTGRNFEVINMGIPSIGPRDFLSVMVNEGAALDPDMVLLTFCTEDDFYRKPSRRILSSSAFYNLVRYLIYSPPETKGRRNLQAAYRDSDRTFPDNTYLDIKKKRSSIYIEDNIRFPDVVKRTVYYYRQIKEICDHLGVPLVVLIGPDELQVDSKLQENVAAALGREMADFDFSRPNRHLRRSFAKMGIHLVDLLPVFQKISGGNGALLYKPNDTHWNLAGNRVAAENVYREIMSIAGRGRQ